MQHIHIYRANSQHSKQIDNLLKALFLELDPTMAQDIAKMDIDKTANALFAANKIWVFLATVGATADSCNENEPIAILTLHECAALYAGGIFGEISELYVKPEYRSLNIGAQLIDNAIKHARTKQWKRLEVGSPPIETSQRTINFYQKQGFTSTGLRLKHSLFD